MATHRPEEPLGPLETAELGGAEQALVDQLCRRFDAECILADPIERVEVAQAALAVLDVGFDDVAAVAHPAMALVALGELGGDIIARSAGDYFGPKAAKGLFEQFLVAPQPAALEQRGAGGRILLRRGNQFVGRSDRLADLQFQVPQYVEQRLDHLIAPRRSAPRDEAHEVEIAVGRHLAPPGAAQADNGDPLCVGASSRMEPLSDEVEGEADDLVCQEGVGGGDHPAATGLDGEPPRNLASARLEHGFELCRRLPLEICVRQPLQLPGDRPAVDDCAPVGNQREARRLFHQPSAASRFSA